MSPPVKQLGSLIEVENVAAFIITSPLVPVPTPEPPVIVTSPPLALPVPAASPPLSASAPPAAAAPPLPPAPADMVSEFPAAPAAAAFIDIVWSALVPKAISPVLFIVKDSTPDDCRSTIFPLPVLLM